MLSWFLLAHGCGLSLSYIVRYCLWYWSLTICEVGSGVTGLFWGVWVVLCTGAARKSHSAGKDEERSMIFSPRYQKAHVDFRILKEKGAAVRKYECIAECISWFLRNLISWRGLSLRSISLCWRDDAVTLWCCWCCDILILWCCDVIQFSLPEVPSTKRVTTRRLTRSNGLRSMTQKVMTMTMMMMGQGIEIFFTTSYAWSDKLPALAVCILHT